MARKKVKKTSKKISIKNLNKLPKDLKKVKPSKTKKKPKKISPKSLATISLKTEHDIAMDFAEKIYQRFNKIVKSVILFGSTVKQDIVAGSDIDIIIVLDDVSLKWDEQLIAWYRAELEKILRNNPYKKSLHINTIKLSTWWEDLLRGDPVVINVIRYGEAMIDLAGFFEPLKYLLVAGKIKSTPEAIYASLQRAPAHIARSRSAELGSIEGLYWSMVDSAHAALIAANVSPPSPEHIALELRENFVKSKVLKSKYVDWYIELLTLHKKIMHGEIRRLKGIEVDQWQDRAEEFLEEMARIVKQIIS